MANNQSYDWKRFWCPKGGRYSLSDDGYLLDPDTEFIGMLQPDVVSLETVSDKPCLVLLGEPGIGKTQELKGLRLHRERELGFERDRLLYLDLRSYGDENRLYKAVFESPEWIAWTNETYTLEVYLDSLDECMIHMKTVSALLADEFRRFPTSRLWLRIACRTAEWPRLLDVELSATWGSENFGVYELLPLRRVDVETAASSEGIDTAEFMQAIEKNNLKPFAIKPITLLMLIQEFKEKTVFSGTQTELYHEYCLRLCRDPSLSRQSSNAKRLLDARQKLAVVERIAAISIFGKRTAIYKGADEEHAIPHEDATVSELVGGEESVSGVTFEVTEEAIDEVLKTGLFSGGPGERSVWSHWTYAEFLAAHYLQRHGVTDEQVIDLIFHPQRIGDDHRWLIPQLQETAAWFAVMRPSVFDLILKRDPQALLRSPVSRSDYSQRSALVSSLLALADARKITDMEIGLRQRYKALDHPGLADQLRPYITDKTKWFLVRRMAIDIAESCRIETLVDDLLYVALDETEELQNRTQAARALLEVADAEARGRLRPLLEAGEADEADQLKGCALSALWPEHMSSEELFSHITPPKRESYFGTYQLFLTQELVSGLNQADFPTALAWVQKQPRDNALSYSYRKIIGQILRRSWQHLDDDRVLESLAQVSIERLKNYEPLLGDNHEKTADVDLDCASKRFRLVEAIISKMDASQLELSQLFLGSGLLRSDDIFWLISKFQSCHAQTEAHLWVKCICFAYDWDRPDHTEAVFEAKKTSPLLESEFSSLFDPIGLDSPEAEKLRRRHQQEVRWRKKEVRVPRRHPPLQQIVSEWLDKFEAGDIDAWWRLNLDMTLEPDSDEYPYDAELVSDLTALPGWKAVNDFTRERILMAARDFLERGDPKPSEWLGKNIFYRPAAAGFKALLLLRTVRPELLSQLRDEVWGKWAPIVLAFPESHSVDSQDPLEKIVALTYLHAPEQVLSTLEVLIDKDNEAHSDVFVMHKLERAWDDHLVDSLLQKIVSDSALRPKAVESLLKKPIELGFSDALKFAVSLIRKGLTEDRAEREKAKYCAALLLIHKAREGWQILKSMLEKDVEFVRDAIIEVARVHRNAEKITDGMDEKSVADLYIWITRQFPPSEDPRFEGARFVGPRESVAYFRDALLHQLREKGTPAAVEAIRYIAGHFPEQAWLGAAAIEARQAALRRTWQGHDPKAILELVQDRDRRLVENGEQLLDVVIASLKRFQSKLHGETPALPDLWNEDSMTPKEESRISDRIKRHLEDDLRGKGIIVNREVEIRRGQETDLRIDAVRDSFDVVSIIVEVKGCWHQEVKTAMETQLRGRYLKENQCEFGLYVVAWFLCDKWNKRDYRKGKTPRWTLQKAQDFFDKQAADLSRDDKILRAFVLDAALR